MKFLYPKTRVQEIRAIRIKPKDSCAHSTAHHAHDFNHYDWRNVHDSRIMVNGDKIGIKIMRIISYDPLWKKLVDAKINRTELAEKAGLSRGTITKMGKNEPVGLDAILKVCNYLDCGIEDVVSIQAEEQ